MKEMQEEAMQKAASQADPCMKAIAASAAALKVAANGLMPSVGDAYVKSEDWTKNLDTDDQTVLLEAKEAQERASMAIHKMHEILASGNVIFGDSDTTDSIVKRKRR